MYMLDSTYFLFVFKKPTPITTPILHQKIDRVIEQESPRQNLPISYALPLKEARVSNVPRSVYAALSNVQFPGIFDREGDPPVMVDVTSTTLPSRAVEINDGLNTNEIIVQFMAFKRLNKHEAARRYAKPVFTLQFYLVDSDHHRKIRNCRFEFNSFYSRNRNNTNGEPSILMRLNQNGEEQKENGAGFAAKYLVDRQRQNEDDRDEFISYLSTNSLCIESWDAESLIYLGASYVPLQVKRVICCPAFFYTEASFISENWLFLF
ncbi:hypothetical protein COOONC_16357 [Cooperia oncophora]